MAEFAPHGKDGWSRLRDILLLVTSQSEDEPALDEEDLESLDQDQVLRDFRTQAKAQLRRLFTSTSWEFSGRPGSLAARHEIIDWPMQERSGVEPNSTWTGIHHPSGATYFDVHMRSRPRGMRRSDPQHVRHDRAGRPSSHDPIKAEWERRRENGEMLASGRQEAEALLAWFDRSYPKATRRPVSKTVRNWLARRFRPA